MYVNTTTTVYPVTGYRGNGDVRNGTWELGIFVSRDAAEKAITEFRNLRPSNATTRFTIHHTIVQDVQPR
jgi:hypothetical protein